MPTASTHGFSAACNTTSIPAEQRARWLDLGKEIHAAVEDVRELPDGYACRLPTGSATIARIAEYVSLERLCCSFLRWSIVVEPAGGPVWLQVTGPEETKSFVRDWLDRASSGR